jgi:hypothetical protein
MNHRLLKNGLCRVRPGGLKFDPLPDEKNP